MLRFFLFYQNKTQLQDNQTLILETTLLSEPRLTSKNQNFSVNFNSSRIFITTGLFPQYHYGTKLKISGTLKIRVINNKTQFLSMNFPKIEARSGSENKILAVTSFIRQKIITFFTSNLSPNYSGLLLGIVFGIKESIPSDFLNNLRQVGVMHVIAASGMNVTMAGGFISSIFFLLLQRQLALVLSIFGILFYAVLAGGEPSIIRASIMGILVFTASILGRQAWPAFALFLTGYLMLFWDPALLFDIGFQLSFLATLGLLYLPAGPLRLSEASRQGLNPVFKHPLLDSFQTTIFAQIATLPVIIANFGLYSLWSVLANGAVLWTIPTLMAIGGVSAIISLIIEPVAKLVLLLSLPLLIYFETVVRFFSGLGGLVNITSVNWAMILGYYLILSALIIQIGKRVRV